MDQDIDLLASQGHAGASSEQRVSPFTHGHRTTTSSLAAIYNIQKKEKTLSLMV